MSDGKGCECWACCEGSCCCEGVDWTPKEVYDLKAECDEIKAGRASFFDVHAKMQDRLSDAEDDNAQLREAMNNIQNELCKIGPWSFHEDVSKHVEASEQYAQIALQEGGGA